jgi:hypothetical protein
MLFRRRQVPGHADAGSDAHAMVANLPEAAVRGG